MKVPLFVVLTMCLISLDGTVEPDTDMSIDERIIAAYDSLPETNRLDNPEFVRVELDMLYRLDVWASMRDENPISGRKRRKAVWNREHLWPNAVVPYEMAATFSASDVKELQRSMNDYQKYTCIRFREKTKNDTDFVRIEDQGACNAQVGRQKSVQMLSLGLRCRTKPMILHELGHAIGLTHEHSRPDRDDYIIVNETNVRPEYVKDLFRYTAIQVDTFGIPYDYLSIMHYSKYAASNGNMVITTKDPLYQNVIGKQKGLSFRDVKIINMLYRCREQNQCHWKFCPGEGFVGQDCQCWCPSNNNLTAAEPCRRDEGVIKMELDAQQNVSRTELWLTQQISAIEMNKSRLVDHPDRWLNATVPFKLQAPYNRKELATLYSAFEEFHTYSCLRFRELIEDDDQDYVIFRTDYDCASELGRKGGGQYIYLGFMCIWLPVILHQLSHTVGVRHEHNRPDRDEYITIIASNISPEYEHEFEKDNISEMYTDYDYLSLMQFNQFFGSLNRQQTMVAKNASYQGLMGRWKTFSFSDVKRLNMMYQCAERNDCSTLIRCPAHGFVGQDCKCWCPDPRGGVPAVHCTECIDYEQLCASMSEYGFCTRNNFENYMKYTCPRSCRLCSPNASP